MSPLQDKMSAQPPPPLPSYTAPHSLTPVVLHMKQRYVVFAGVQQTNKTQEQHAFKPCVVFYFYFNKVLNLNLNVICILSYVLMGGEMNSQIKAKLLF